jgi:hypothetical protein
LVMAVGAGLVPLARIGNDLFKGLRREPEAVKVDFVTQVGDTCPNTRHTPLYGI